MKMTDTSLPKRSSYSQEKGFLCHFHELKANYNQSETIEMIKNITRSITLNP